MNRNFILAIVVTLGCFSTAQSASLPPGKTAYTVLLAAVADPYLVGNNVDVVARIMTNNSAVSSEKIVLKDVLLIAIRDNEWAASDRRAVLALSPQEIRKLEKMSERVGVDILIKSR